MSSFAVVSRNILLGLQFSLLSLEGIFVSYLALL
jgi:hypothetical protein